MRVHIHSARVFSALLAAIVASSLLVSCSEPKKNVTPESLVDGFSQALQNNDKEAVAELFLPNNPTSQQHAAVMGEMVDLTIAADELLVALTNKFPDQSEKIDEFNIQNPMAKLGESLTAIKITVDGDKAYGSDKADPVNDPGAVQMARIDGEWYFDSLGAKPDQVAKMSAMMQKYKRAFQEATAALNETTNMEEFKKRYTDAMMNVMFSGS